jgi:hypothetical protein
MLALASRLKQIYSANNYTRLTVTVQDLAGSLTDHRTALDECRRVSAPLLLQHPPPPPFNIPDLRG